MRGSRNSRILALIAAAGLAAALTPLGNTASRDTAFPTLYVTVHDELHVHDRRRLRQSRHGDSTRQLSGRGLDADHVPADQHPGSRAERLHRLQGLGAVPAHRAGRSLGTTLDIGCESDYLLPATYFKPNSTYIAQDLNNPAGAHASITTLSSGSPTLPTNPSGTGTGKGTASTDIVGEGIPARDPRPRDRNPEPVRHRETDERRQGRHYDQGRPVQVLDHRPKPTSGLHPSSSQDGRAKSSDRQGIRRQAFDILALTAGRWTYVSDGKKASFVVTG